QRIETKRSGGAFPSRFFSIPCLGLYLLSLSVLVLYLRHIFCLPRNGIRTSLRFAFGLAGREHGGELIVDGRRPSRRSILRILCSYVSAGKAFAHPRLGREFPVRLHYSIDRAAVDTLLQPVQAFVEVDDLLIRYE